MMKRFVMAGLVMGACTSIPSSNGVDGTVVGNMLAVADATWSIAGLNGGGQAVEVDMSSTPGICGDLATAVRHPGQQLIHMILVDVGKRASLDAAPTEPDSYKIATHEQHLAFWTVMIYDAGCKPTYIGAPNGEIGLDQIGATAAGTFDVTTSTDEHVTGQFHGAACASVDLDNPTCI